jgi:hypothetical protein
VRVLAAWPWSCSPPSIPNTDSLALHTFSPRRRSGNSLPHPHSQPPHTPRPITDRTRSRICALPGRQRTRRPSVLSQLHVDKCWLVASLGGAQEARALARELEADGVSTRYCKVWEGAAVPAAWVLHACKLSLPLPFIAHLRRREGGILMPPPPVTDTSSSSIDPTTPSALRCCRRRRRRRHLVRPHNGIVEARSVRSGSGFWAVGDNSSHGSSAYSASQLNNLSGRSDLSHSHSHAHSACG